MQWFHRHRLWYSWNPGILVNLLIYKCNAIIPKSATFLTAKITNVVCLKTIKRHTIKVWKMGVGLPFCPAWYRLWCHRKAPQARMSMIWASDGIRNLCGRPVCYCTVEKMWLCLNIYHFPLTISIMLVAVPAQIQTREAERAAGHHFLTLLWPTKLQYVTTAAPCKPPSTAPSLGAGEVVMETRDQSLMVFKSQTNDRPDSKINTVLWNRGSIREV